LITFRPDHRYLIVFGACLTQFTVIGWVVSYGLFFKTFETEFGWSRTLLSGGFSLAFLVMGLLAAFGGQLSDRYGPRLVLAFTGTMCGLGFILLSQMNHAWQLLLVFSLFIGTGMSTHDVVTLSTIARWFKNRRGVMTGIVKVGTAAGQFTIPPIAAVLLITYGWRSTFMIMGFTAIILLLFAAWAIKAPTTKTNTNTPDTMSGYSFAEARHTPIFWIICTVEFLFLPSLATIPLHIVVHGMDLGMTTTVAAALVSTMAASSVLARLAVGSFFDKVGGKVTIILCLVTLLGSLLALLAIDTPYPLFAVMVVYGFAHGGLFTVMSPTIAEYFGLKAHGTLFGSIIFFGTISAATAPILAGYIFDTTGSYSMMFRILIVMVSLGLILTLMLPRHSPKNH
jgi:MFS family permease